METALSADYQELAQKCQDLFDVLDHAVGAELVFSTGEKLYIDLRNRHAKIDDGQLPADKSGARVINLPSGEVYIAPYEGEIPGKPSLTAGRVPVIFGGEWLTLEVQNNRFTNSAVKNNPRLMKCKIGLTRMMPGATWRNWD